MPEFNTAVDALASIVQEIYAKISGVDLSKEEDTEFVKLIRSKLKLPELTEEYV